MALQYLAGQRLTADALQRAVPDRVEQAADQSVTSSVTPVDSAIAITVDGLLKIDLEVRYTSGGGGIRWIWDADAGVTFMSRSVRASGSATSGDRKRTRLNSSHYCASRMPSSACKKNMTHEEVR